MKPNVNHFPFFSLLTVMLLFAVFSVYGQNNGYGKDTAIVNGYKARALEFLKENNMDSAVYYSKKITEYAEKTEDSFLMAEGYFITGYNYDAGFQVSKAFEQYYKGVDIALRIKDTTSAIRMLINMVILQNTTADYSGAQDNATKALQLINKAKDSARTYILYNSLANAFRNAEDYDSAIQAHNEAIAYAQSIQEKARSMNNLANVYRDKELYNEAIKLYKDALKDSAEISTATKARLLDNLGFAEFLSGDKKGILLMEKALWLRKSIDDKTGMFASHIHLIQYYLEQDNGRAAAHSREALQTATVTKSPDMEAEALSYYIQLHPNVIEHIKRYVFLTDSIDTAQKTARNKYAGIIYQTEKKEAENLRLKQEKKEREIKLAKESRNKWIFGGGLAAALVILGLVSFYYRRNQKQKNTIENLQKELHHRIKNNLAIIDTFIELAKEEFTDAKFENKLSELQNRINSINEVHQQLYINKDVTNLNLKKYIETLAHHVAQSFDDKNAEIHIQIPDNLYLNPEKSFPVGLIVNEFITNSLKYAFGDTQKGKINIQIFKTGKEYELKLHDNGKGLPENFDIGQTASFGIRVMRLLSQQLKGSFNLNNNQGVQLNVKFVDK